MVSPLLLDWCELLAVFYSSPVLCKACNTGLGGFRDDPAHLEAAIRYLRKP